ncbi:GGDEF domain-containing protein [Acinetobacter silvestris]|uniref:diguanylate cyclase n=1 Tax=Acinetobacter silvestris TaxID=1977882 RepID=A0A1Y3CD82_9GAMM|nr:GGDEF domain-containing protein [Acinetobacter silvestris]OTG63862.1 GGDEF domain-containing protein [Acinetobacter silvestris]
MSIGNRKKYNHNDKKKMNSLGKTGEQNTHNDTAYIIPEQLCTNKNRVAIEQALTSPITRIPTQFKQYYLDYQNKHQRQLLQRVNLIGQLTFLSYFFVDWFLLPDIATLSALLRLILIISTLLINEFLFRYCKNIKILDSLLPIYVAIAAAAWLKLLLISDSPVVTTYLYASVIFILLGNLCIQISFRYSIFTSLLISSVIFHGVSKLVNLHGLILFSLTYIPILLLSMYISWNNTLNSKRSFLRILLNDWNYHALCELAHTDELTQLNNRRQFMHVAEQAIQKWQKHNVVCLLIFDIDFFKKINDTYGHDTGDEVLRILAEILRQEMRFSDVLARFGGEEFIALLPNTTLEDATLIAHRLCKKIENHHIYIQNKISLNLSISIGLSQLLSCEDDLSVLIKHADIALYQAKNNGRNQVAIYSCE